jgi:hypothetical protein
MAYQPKRMDVQAAKEDLETRTLSGLGYDFARLIYLSSLRDSSSGEYFHHGLADSFSESAASAAMAACHLELFYRLAQGPLQSLVIQLDRFIRATRKDYQKTLAAWETLEAYKTTVPSVCDQITLDLFRSNVKIGMALLKSGRLFPGEKSQSASQHPLLAQ